MQYVFIFAPSLITYQILQATSASYLMTVLWRRFGSQDIAVWTPASFLKVKLLFFIPSSTT